MLQWRQREAASGAAFPLFCAGKQWLGPAKKPRRERTGEVRPASRARNQVREPRRRKTRPPAQGRARRIRAQKRVPPPGGAQAGGGADGRERNGTRRRERYAGTEPQSFGGGMGNMTCHDTMQGVSHESPRARNQVREPRRRKTRPPAQGRARRIRAQKWVPPPGAPRPAAARTEGSGTEREGGAICRNAIAELRRRHGEHDKT